MKRQISYFVPILVFLFIISVNAFSQKEKFDIISYTAPKDWKKEAKDDVVNYMNVNATTGKFCVVAIYASSASSGDALKDFTNAWTALVVEPFSAAANPKTEIETTAEGWKAVLGAAPVTMDGTEVYIILTVFSGFGKTVSVRTSMNDQDYTSQIDLLLQSMVFDKSGSSLVNTEPANVKTSAAKGKFGKMMYRTPQGWSEQKFSDGVVFKPLDLPADEQLAIQIMDPLVGSGTLQQALAQSFAEATSMYNSSSMYQADGAYSKNEPKTSFNGWDYIRGKGSIKHTNGNELGLEVFVVKLNNRFERIAILESRKNCGGVSSYFATDRIHYRNAIEDLLYSLVFTDFNREPLNGGSAKGTGIIGLWQGTIQGTGAAMGVNLEVFSPIFFTNGQVYFGPKFPTEGLDELNSRIPPELYPRNWGTYTFNNGSGVLKMPFAEIPIKMVGNKLIITKNQREWPMYKMKPVDGARFEGTYTMSESYGIFPVITFTAGGQFTDKGVIRVLYHDGNTCVNPGYRPGSGNYEVRNHSVIFSYSDGRKVKVAFLGTDFDIRNPSPPTLRMSFNDDPLTRQ